MSGRHLDYPLVALLTSVADLLTNLPLYSLQFTTYHIIFIHYIVE